MEKGVDNTIATGIPVMGFKEVKAFMKQGEPEVDVIGQNKNGALLIVREDTTLKKWLNLVCGDVTVAKFSRKANRWYAKDSTLKEHLPELPRTSQAVSKDGDEAKGKRLPHTTTVKCMDCGAERTIKVQDAFQVKRCVECQKEYRRRRRAELRRQRAKEAKDTANG
jgi:hypothetical protein